MARAHLIPIGLLLAALPACEKMDDFEATILVPDAVARQYTEQAPGELMLAHGPDASGLGESGLRLAVICGAAPEVEQVRYYWNGGFGCSKEKHYLAWIAPLGADEVGVAPCGVEMDTSSEMYQERGRVLVLARPEDAPFLYDGTMPQVRHVTNADASESQGCVDGQGLFEMLLAVP